MNLKERIQTVLQKLNLLDKAKANQLTQEEWGQIVNSYNQEYQSILQDDLAADQAAQRQTVAVTQEQIDQVQSILGSIVNPVQTNSTATEEGNGGNGPVQTVAQPANGEGLVQLATAVQSLVDNMNNRAEDDIPSRTVTASSIMFTGPADRSQYLFGIENPMFSMSERWNRIAVNPALASSFGPWDEENEGAAFRRQAVTFSRSLQQRYSYLHRNGMLDAKRLAAGEFSTNYEGVNTAGVGNQYVVLRQDALIARVLAVRDLTQYFPVRYGIQDHDLVFNAFFSEVSQAYQQGEIWKSDMKLENEMGHVDDAMIKLKFGPMKELERMYIAYLNKEGSDPIKWNMIEFCILNSLETAQVEQNKRRMRGIYVKPETGVAGSYLNASTGIIYTLVRYMQRKIDYWVAGTNENAEYYSPGSNGEAADTYSSSMGYQDGSYIKVRNISLGYNFTTKQLKNTGLSNLKVYVQAMNPFSIYKACDWLDTDLMNYDNNKKTFGSPTTIKSFVIGVNIGF